MIHIVDFNESQNIYLLFFKVSTRNPLGQMYQSEILAQSLLDAARNLCIAIYRIHKATIEISQITPYIESERIMQGETNFRAAACHILKLGSIKEALELRRLLLVFILRPS